jgi:hypothetical protein
MEETRYPRVRLSPESVRQAVHHARIHNTISQLHGRKSVMTPLTPQQRVDQQMGFVGANFLAWANEGVPLERYVEFFKERMKELRPDAVSADPQLLGLSHVRLDPQNIPRSVIRARLLWAAAKITEMANDDGTFGQAATFLEAIAREFRKHYQPPAPPDDHVFPETTSVL